MTRALKLLAAGVGAAVASAAASICVWSSLPDSGEQNDLRRARSYQAYLKSQGDQGRLLDASASDARAVRARTYFGGAVDAELDRATGQLRAMGEPSLRDGGPGTAGALRLFWLPARGDSACLRFDLSRPGSVAYLMARASPGAPPIPWARTTPRREGVLGPAGRRDLERRLAAAAIDDQPRYVGPGTPAGTLIAESTVGGRYTWARCSPADPGPALRRLFDLLTEVGGVEFAAPSAIPVR